MDFTFNSIQDFNDYFKDERTCYEFFEQQRWGGKPVCPHCGSEKHYKVKPRGKFQDIPSYRCANRACDLPFTVRTNSIFEGSKVELRKWFQAAYEISTSKKGISSVELATRIRVSQKTAWFINHRIRTMLADTEPTLLKGEIQVDETYVGGKEKNKHAHKRQEKGAARGRSQIKTAVIGLYEKDGKVITHVTPWATRKVAEKLIEDNVEKGATMVTDAYSMYNRVGKLYNHIIVNHSEGIYVNDNKFHTNNIENFWSQLKRGYVGIYHYMSPKHLQRYCNEFASRYNQRMESNISRFVGVVKNAGKARITYKDLTSSIK